MMVKAAPIDIIDEARQLLSASNGLAASRLAVSDEFVSEGDWVHVIVYPTAVGISALDFLDEIEAIERKLRDKFGDEILVVPAKP